MALVRCKECRKKISDQSPACVQCGAPRVPAPPRKKLRDSGLVKFLFASVMLIVMIDFFDSALDTPAQTASAGQAVSVAKAPPVTKAAPAAKAPPVKKPEKVVAASTSDSRTDRELVVDLFVANNMEEIRQAANRELCRYQSVKDFVGAAKVILLMDRNSPSFPELSSRAQSYFTQKFYAAGRALLAKC